MRVCNRQGLACVAALLAVLFLISPSASRAAPAHGRAWELVTAGPTNGVKMIGARAWSPDGERVVYATIGPMAGAPAGELTAHGLARRTAHGWTLQPVGVPFTVATFDLEPSLPVAIAADFGTWVWASALPLLPEAPAEPQMGLYRLAADGRLTLLGDAGARNDFAFAGASEDLRHVVFQSQSHLLAADAGRVSGSDVYELAGSQLRLVGADTSGAAISACGSSVGSGDPTFALLQHAISHDGTRVFFTAPSSADCGTPRRVYVREDGSQTTETSASACTRLDCNAPQDVTFAGATPDGAHAFLITAQQLTDDDVDDSPDLYRYDLASHALTRLSAGPPGAGAEVSGTVVRASDDGERVYFTASGALVPGASDDGNPNLYLSDHGQLRYVATPVNIDLSSAAITADGRFLAFTTEGALLPSDTDASTDVYRYDADGGTLVEVSLGTGGRGNEESPVAFGSGSRLPAIGQEQQRWMSADGARVFFTTSEPLVPEDVNQTVDVYEWADGTTGLVSSGAGDDSVEYAGVSADGRSAFFITDESLVPADRNAGDQDLYAARLGGGFPPLPSPPPPCVGDACQGPPGSRLVRPVPDSTGHVASARGLRMRAFGPGFARRLAAAGSATLVVEAPAAGRVSVVARARIGGHATVVARAAATVRAAGTVRLRLRLSRAARRTLRHRPLRVTLRVREGHLEVTRTIVVRLRSAA